MLLQLVSARTDVSDFWRPRLMVTLDVPHLPAGIYRVQVTTRLPAYATVRLGLDGQDAPMTAFLDREGDCCYAKSFSVPRAIARAELETEPHLDRSAIVSTELVRLSAGKLLAGRVNVLRQLGSPLMLARKVRQVLSGGSRLAFSSTVRLNPETIYEAWRTAHESEVERHRISAEVRRLAGSRQLKLLFVTAHTDGQPVLQASASCDDRAGVTVERLAVESGQASLTRILSAAEEVGAFAFAILDGPGRWSAFAPAMIAVEMLRHRDCLAVYGDSDRVDETGRRIDPRFKPDWSPSYQLGIDYVRSAVAFRVGDELRALAQRGDIPPATSFGLLARLAGTGGAPAAVRHVPRVFLHEMRDEDRQPPPQATLRVGTMHAVRPSVSVIMPSRDNPHLLREAVRSVLDEPLPNLELVVVDNGSKDRSQLALLDKLRDDPRVRVICDPSPFNFSALINRGVRASTGEMLLLLNDDIQALNPNWLGLLADVAGGVCAGCAGALLLYPSGRIQHAGVILGTFGVAGHAFRNLAPEAPAAAGRLAAVHEVSAVTAACLAARRKVFEDVGGFDEALPVTLNDVDFCLRVRARGYTNLMVPHVRLTHREATSRGLDVTPAQAERLTRETAYFLSKWGPGVLRDPFYSPHLTLTREDGSLRDI
jgi:GT2 family glycosyltransferase